MTGFGRLVVASLAAAAAGLALGHRALAQAPCDGCAAARFWNVPAEFWTQDAPGTFPETARLEELGRPDLGVAFSGGGTRSASATLGQLRGLRANGWLDKVRYVTAASGGSWTLVPYVYYRGADLEALLGTPRTGVLDSTAVKTPNGLQAGRIADSGLLAYSLQEVPLFLPDEARGVDLRPWRSGLLRLRGLVRRVRGRDLPDPDRENKTYARLIGQAFLEDLVPDAIRRPYTWDVDAAVDESARTGQPIGRFSIAPDDRPFWIVGGTLIRQHPALDYPQLIPVEYTPLYTGIRQTYGPVGGTYVSPWAYDRTVVAPGTEETIWASPGPGADERIMTLADVIASSGAAPQLNLLLGDRFPERVRGALARMAGTFPAFANVAVRGAEPNPAGDELPHGDGGFTDNLALMPLLARQVRNVLVFVNSNKTWRENGQLQSYFMPLDVRDGGGDKSMNAVFDEARLVRVIRGLDAAAAEGDAAVYCESNWSVASNQRYNIHSYGGLNICWIYNHAADDWKTTVDDTIRGWLNATARTDESKDLRNFPYYATFGQNVPTVIKLNPLQVNLLADLASWSVTSEDSVARITASIPASVLPPPR